MSEETLTDALGTNPNSRRFLDEAAESLAQVLEAMTGERPQAAWQLIPGMAAGAAAAEGDILWWEQHFQFSPDAVVWLGAPRVTWEYAGNLALKAAGLEEPPEGEARKTWLEIGSQWFSALARCLGSLVESEVLCAGGGEAAPPVEQEERVELSLTFGETALAPLIVTISQPLVRLLHAPDEKPAIGAASATPADTDAARAGTPAASRTLDLLLDVELPVSISFGKTELPLKDVLKLTTGSIVELNRGVNDPVEVLVNHCLVARGEVVVVDGNYGVRIQHIVSREDRLRSLR